MIVYSHRIAGLHFRTELNVDLLADRHYQVYEKFRTSDDVSPDIHQRIVRLTPEMLTTKALNGRVLDYYSQLKPRRPHAAESQLLRVEHVYDRLEYSLDHPNEVKVYLGQEHVIIADLPKAQLEIIYTPRFGKHEVEFGGYFPELHIAADLRHIFATLLPRFSAMAIHGSGIIRHGKAAFFIGPDGVGKTTIIRSAPGGLILNDDHVILRKQGDEFVAHGSPLGPLSDGPNHARLGGVFVLRWHDTFDLRPLGPSDLLQCLWGEQVAGYSDLLTADLKGSLFNLLYDLCYKAPVYLLRFPKDHVDWDAIDAVLQA